MKIAGKIIAVLAIFMLLAYLAIYLALPYFLNSKNYSGIISETVKKQTNLDLVIRSYKICVSPSLHVKLKTGHSELYYPDKKQILDIQDAQIDFSTLALLKKEIKIKSFEAKKVQLSAKILKNGKFSIQDYLEKNLKNTSGKEQQTSFRISDEIPSVKINSLLVKIKDENTEQKFKFKGENLKLQKALLRSNLQLSVNGDIFYFNEKYFNYKLKLLFPSSVLKDIKLKPVKLTFDNLEKYKFHADIDADLRIEKPDGKVLGIINIDKFSMISGGVRLPESYFHFLFEKNKGGLDSSFYTAKNEKALIKAGFDNANNIYIKCSTKKLSFKNLKPVLITLCDLLRIKNELNDFDLNGWVESDFEAQTNLKKIKSHGKLKIIDTSINHKLIPLKITSVNADVDFSNNNIRINSSKMLVNGQNVRLNGTIDEKANADLTLSAANLQLSHIMNAFTFLKPAKSIIVKSGKLSFDAKLKGELSKVSPKIYALITNFSADENTSHASIAFEKLTLNIKNATAGKFNGTIDAFNTKIKLKDLPSFIASAKIVGTIDEKEFLLLPSKFTYDKASATVKGSIKNYLKSPESNLTLFGTIDTRLIKSILPPDVPLYTKGVLPIGAQIKAQNDKITLQANLLANEDAYVTPILIKNIKAALFHISADLNIKNENMVLHDCSLYYPPAAIKLSEKPDTSKLRKIINIDGEVKNLKNPVLSEFHVIIPEPLYISYEALKSGYVTSDLNLNGNISSPEITGILSLSELNSPPFYAKRADIKTDKKFFYAKIESAKVENTFINIDASAQNDFMATKIIDYVNVSAQNLDLNDLAKLSEFLPKSEYTPGNTAPFEIQTGKLRINSFKIDNVKAQNITSDFKVEKNVLSLNNLRAGAYGGNIAAEITYNMPYILTKAKIQARNLDSAAAAADTAPKDMQVSGRLNFDADISMSGLTESSRLKTLKGNADIMITSAQLGPLGRFEHFLHAQNLLSQRLIFASLNSAKRAVAPKNTGYVDVLKGVLSFRNGMVYISPVTTSGPQMSMYITGTTNLLTEIVDIEILGRVSPDVSDSMGFLGDITIKNLLDEHTKYGETISKLFTSFNTELPEMDISKIPPLSSKYVQETKNFRVLIEGNPNSVKSIKSFTWINPTGTQSAFLKQKAVQSNPQNSQTTTAPAQNRTMKPEQQKTQTEQPKPQVKPAAGFLDSIPDDFQ